MLINSFLNYIEYEKRYSPHTVTSYKNDLEKFEAYLQIEYELIDLLEAKYIHIRSWIVSLVNDKLSSKSINRKISSLKSFYKYYKKKGRLKINPTIKIIAPKLSKRLPKYIPTDNMSKLFSLDNIFDDDFAGLRDRVILELLYSTGMRRAELLQLKHSDIDLYKQNLKVLGKGNKQRLIPFHNKIKELLSNYMRLKGKEFATLDAGFLIVTNKGKASYPKFIYNTVVKYLSLITTSKDKSPHVLRHSFATHLTDKGAELNAVKTLLGHSSLAATQVYTHNSIEKLKRVYEKSHPKAKNT